MDINKFTEKLQEALGAAQSKAVRYGHQQVDVEHLLLALLEQDRGLATSILNKANVAVDSIRRRLEQELEKIPRVSSPSGGADNVHITTRLNRLLTQAEDESKSSAIRTSPSNMSFWQSPMTMALPAASSKNPGSLASVYCRCFAKFVEVNA